MATPGWNGRYVVEDHPEASWSDCAVVDISVFGVGLELFPAVDERMRADLLGRRIHVEVIGAGDSVSLGLFGEVRHVGDGEGGGTRAGLEFVDLTDRERAILEMMETLKRRW